MKNNTLTIPQMFLRSVKQYATNPLIYEKVDDHYQSKNYQEVYEQVVQFSAALLKLGLKKGQCMALLSEGRSEWLVSELAMLFIGVIDVPLSVKLNELSDLIFRINHSDASMVVVSTRQLDKIRAIKKELPKVKQFIIIGDEENLEDREIAYNQILKADNLEEYREEVLKICHEIQGDDVANISYTSGTTADPKGIMLTHRNYTSNVEQAASVVDVHSYYSSLLILPWDHSFAHTVGLYTLINNGASMAVVELGKTMIETLKNIPKNIKETKPTFLLSVPALAKNFKNNIEKGIRDSGAFAERLFKHALKLSIWYNREGYNKGGGIRSLVKPLLSLYDKILFSKVRAGFGGRLEFFIGGGALLDIELQKFFYAIGLPMYQGYGLSEAAPIISSNGPKKHKMGSSGVLVDQLQIRIVDGDGNNLGPNEKGEIVVKGENVMKGYWKNEEATNETIKDGWLFTGDMGYLDADGFLYVLGRFKSLLISNDGEKYSPEGIEEALMEQSQIIEQVVLYNNQNPYTIALVHLNYAKLSKLVKERNSSENPERVALDILQEEFQAYHSGGIYEHLFPHRWLPSAIGLMDEAMTEANGLINSTMKVVRNKAVDQYQDLVDYLYSPGGKDVFNPRNQEVVKKNL